MRVSIVMASYNGGRYIGAQLQSLLEQQPPPDEIIISDDGSDDATPAVVADLAARFPATAVRFTVNTGRLGVTGNFARALELAGGDVLFFCDQDDWWSPGRLAQMVDALARDAGATLVYADGRVTDADLNPTGESLLRHSPLAALTTPTPTAITRVSAAIPGCAIGFPAWLKPYVLPFPAGWFHDHATAYIALALGHAIHAEAPPLLHRRHTANVSPESRFAQRRLFGQWQDSRQAPASLYALEHERWQAMAQRLHAIPAAAATDPARLAAFRAAAGHRADLARQRLDLRRHGRLRRIPAGLRLYLRGDYTRYLRGWRTLARDLFLG